MSSRSARRTGRSTRAERAPAKLGVMVNGLIAAGVIEPPFEIERDYRNRHLKAQIEADGSVSCMGRNFGTLSSAASYARSTCSRSTGAEARPLSSNGWTFWQYRNAHGELENLRKLRRRFLRT